MMRSKWNRDKGFRGQQPLRLDVGLGQPPLKVRTRDCGLAVAPATHHMQMWPEHLRIGHAGAAQRSGAMRLRRGIEGTADLARQCARPPATALLKIGKQVLPPCRQGIEEQA